MATRKESASFARQCLGEALVQLMSSSDYRAISITDICRRAGVSRMTYYRNYDSKDDILTDYMKTLVEQFIDEVRKTIPDAGTRSYDLVLHGFLWFQKYHRFALCLANANLSSIFQQGLNYYMDIYVAGPNADAKRRYALYYYAGALYNLCMVWITGGMKETPQEMAEIVYRRVEREHRLPQAAGS